MGKIVGSALCALVLVAAFAGFVITHAVSSHVATEGYFKNALTSNRVFDRMYDELLVDPKFAPQVDELLGGVDVKRGDLVATMKQLVTPERLQRMADEIIEHLVAHFGNGLALDLTFDITPIVEGVHQVAIQAAVEALKALPTKQADSYEEFLAEFEKVLELMQGQGTLPDAIPTYPIPDEDKEQVAAILVAQCGLDVNDPDQKQVIDFIDDAIAKDDVALAIRVSAAALLEKLIEQSIDALTKNQYVAKVDGADGPHFILGPGADVTAAVDEKLALVRQLNDAARWASYGAAAAIVLMLGLLVLMHRKDPRRLFAWAGGAVLAAGAIALCGWLIAQSMVQGQLGKVAESPGLPPSFQAILRDILQSSVGGLSSSIWIPSIAAIAIGAGLIGAAILMRARPASTTVAA